ncbi:LCP family protein [Spongiactinospora sp. 9N601]|uniref:LCP family protein n=1 Tax=Spongiactinospora sp. 9N601 TaxID=3375149 RepID=UPI003791F32C
MTEHRVDPQEPGGRRAARRAARGTPAGEPPDDPAGYQRRRHAGQADPPDPDRTAPRRRRDERPLAFDRRAGQDHGHGRGGHTPAGPGRAGYPEQGRAGRSGFTDPGTEHDAYAERGRTGAPGPRRGRSAYADPGPEQTGYEQTGYAEQGGRRSRRAALADQAEHPERGRGRTGHPEQGHDRSARGEPPNDDDGGTGRRRKDGDGGGGKMRLLAWGSIALTGLMVAGTLTGYTLYRSLSNGIETEDFNSKLGDKRPPNSTGALNVLLVGSDTREGDNLKYGKYMLNAGKRTDTMILMHISPDRDKATLISFPRDSVVQIPSCPGGNGSATLPPRVEMINAAYNEGGITCTIRTLESLTGVRIDHFVEIDFTGFKNIVDALGGIRVCLKQPVNDRKAKLELKAGWHNLKGEAALGYVRLRGYGDGSDIQRIKRQQVFLSQVVKKATSSDLITDPGQLWAFIKAATKSVKMNPELANNPDTLVQIAQSARKLTSNGVQFITVPWGPHPDDDNRVIWKQPAADKLFAAIKSDIEVKPAPKPTPTPGEKSTAPAKPVIKPAQIKVQVLNGTTVPGRAKEVADALTAQGFKVVEVGNARAGGVDVPKTQVLYGRKAANGADYASPIAAKLLSKVSPQAGKIKPVQVEPYTATAATPGPGSTATASPATGAGAGEGGAPVVQLIVGADWEGVKAPIKIPDDLKGSVVNAKTDPCQ